MFQKILKGLEVTLALIILATLTGYSNPSLSEPTEKVRAYTRNIEFDYIAWMTDAALVKIRAASIGVPYTLDLNIQKKIVLEYFNNTQTIADKERMLTGIFADATVKDKELASQDLRNELDLLYKRQDGLTPLVEAILQAQVSDVAADSGLTLGGQPVPYIWYHSTPLPKALIVSPRDHIEQLANISVSGDLTIDEQAALEDRVDTGLDTSSLVVDLGGVGVYPTMVYRTSNLNWTISTIAHEWTHNYLTLRPLGLSYEVSPELRTMNETTASIAGDEIGALVIKKYYPELANTRTSISFSLKSGLALLTTRSRHKAQASSDTAFDFRAEMHETRVKADELLAEGRIEEAEAYMEARRQVFLQNGYLIRKLNQAYFAFHGAYADVPGGAAGEDPVGPAVRELRAQSDSLADFVKTIAWMWSFDQLQEAVNQ